MQAETKYPNKYPRLSNSRRTAETQQAMFSKKQAAGSQENVFSGLPKNKAKQYNMVAVGDYCHMRRGRPASAYRLESSPRGAAPAER